MAERILLLQLDGKMPNLALMRISAHHLRAGHEVSLRHAPTVRSVEQRHLGDAFDRVYASLIFERTRPVAERLRQIDSAAIIGGTGWDLTTTLEGIGIVAERPDYSIYPDWTQSIGFTQRGCRLKCSFCVVPRKEPVLRQENTIAEIWRGDPWPKHVVILDNDFFGQTNWRERIAEIREGGYRVNFNQGINARMISDEAAEAIAGVDYRDLDMKTRRIYTAWDSLKDEEVLFRGLRRLTASGVKPDHIMVYMLVGFWPGEREDDWLHRCRRLSEFGCRPYPMPYVRNHLTTGFQRWVVGGYHKRIAWADWKAAKCEPRKLGGRVELPMLPFLEGSVPC